MREPTQAGNPFKIRMGCPTAGGGPGTAWSGVGEIGLKFLVLGALEVIDQGFSIALGAPRVRSLLAVLLTRPNEVVSVDRLVDEMWPVHPPVGARAQIHDYVSRLRRALSRGPDGRSAAGRLATRRPGYVLEVAPEELDRLEFERLLGAARREPDPKRALHAYLAAQRLWRGEPFAGVPPTGAISAAAATLVEERLASLEERYALALGGAGGGAGDPRGTVAELTGLVADHPLRERLVAHLMRALYLAGRTAEALNLGRRTRERLADELGVDPGLDLRDTELAILRGEISAPAVKARPVPAAAPVYAMPARAASVRPAAPVAGIASTSPEPSLEAAIGLGQVPRRQCQCERSVDQFQLAIELARATGDPMSEVSSLIGFGYACLLRGEHERAGDNFLQALALARRIDGRIWPRTLEILTEACTECAEDCANSLRIRQSLAELDAEEPAD